MTLSAQRTRSHLNVLLVQHVGHVGRCQSVACHLQRVQPDAHRVVGTHHVHLTYARNTAQSRFDVNLDVNLRIVSQERTVERRVRTIDSYLLDVRGLALAYRQTALHHVAGQSALHGGGTVLHVHHCHVRVGALTEEDTYRGRTVVRCRRRHVHHAFHAVDGLFQGNDDALLYSLGIGACIACHDAYRRWCYFRELLQRQTSQSDDADQHHQHADDSR